jgi:branched-chain amino acid transport system permease protein
MYKLTTRTRAGTATALLAVALVLAGLALPAFTARSVIQDLFFILTMLTLAQLWNLLAGYGGLVSVGQQAFVGIGAYAMFAGVILLGWNPILAIPLGGLAALVLAVPTAFFAFRLQGAYFAIGTWVIAEVTRLLVAQWKALGGGTGTSLPREATSSIMGTDTIQALFGGIIIGVAQTVGAALNPEWQILAGHVAFLVVLLVRPRGLFPRSVD